MIGIRAEEMRWFPMLYLGSRAAFGLLAPDAPDTLRRTDSGRTLAEHMAEEGFDPDFIRQGRSSLDPAYIQPSSSRISSRGRCWCEAGLPAAVVTGIRGTCAIAPAPPRAPGRMPARCRGRCGRMRCWRWRRSRMRWRKFWKVADPAGSDLVLTMGEFFTDPVLHGPTKIPARSLQPRHPQRGPGGAAGDAEALLRTRPRRSRPSGAS